MLHYMRFTFICLVSVLLVRDNLGQQQLLGKTWLDNPLFLRIYWSIRQSLQKTFGAETNENVMSRAKERNIVQTELSENVTFPCDTKNGKSQKVPTSVHQLRPGDIDVIAAIGDSLTAAFGAFATNYLELVVENRGVSGFGGGDSTWRKYLTLPNIIKEFNPNLIGYATSDSLTVDRDSRFNVAESGAISRDMPFMTKVLVKRIKSDPLVDIKRHWKMITIMIGTNDYGSSFCHNAADPWSLLPQHKQDMLETLRTLRDNLPRTIVNFVTAPTTEMYVDQTNRPQGCYQAQTFEIPCMSGLTFEGKRAEYYDAIKSWQNLDYEISRLEEFDRDDFAIVFQPFTTNATNPLQSNGSVDYSYFSIDCFHYSQKGHARVANALWNNLIESKDNKTTNWDQPFKKFNCPTLDHPYIRTNKN